MALNGWIIIDKPIGLGSTQAVGAVKRMLREAGEPKTKVGHGGTLDPLASGILPIALGEATKLAGRMLDATKSYDFTIRFGEETDTLDLEGKVIATSDVHPSQDEVDAILPRFTGPIEQVPPAFSALKVDGERAYDLARAGKEVELKSRSVTVHSLSTCRPSEGWGPCQVEKTEPYDMDASLRWHDGLREITLSATVSKGTYIRSLARDISHALGTVGHVTMLRRTKAGPFALNQAISLDFLQDAAKARRLTETVLPLEAGLDDIPGLPVTPEQAKLLRHGQQLFGIPAVPGLHLATDGETPVALVEASDDGLRVVRGFNL
ncbi:tRNA pseudouridine(55) synthase TruB [Sphingomonas sp. NSE70-1]|uniref:tRNA pseudouridine synthase B n=1 Tax=Sphingomonas caseinilyticus TaxID=2908205 RepID=A0ABT0RT87_9SPHN|nr:tRNA pseudouridine(55) synthase TruB [Sphingomonas caseinilyticus]MCL6698223.1 tRNA pseudouridine(55) synthase TruB [Sphingomonas caseinilyticus]